MAKDNNFNFIDDLEEVKLTDLLDLEELQLAQDTVSKMARMATVITDENGVALTNGSNFSRLCTEFCRKSPEGKKRCENCDKMGAIASLEQNKAVYYYCHANLVDFAAPIMLNGRMIGSFVGGQVLAHEPDLDAMRKTAREIGVDEDAFVEAAKETNVIPRQAIERCTNFVYDFAQMISGLAYKSYLAKKESELVFQAAAAKTDFLANMSHEIRTPMNAIIGMSQIALREEMSTKAREYLTQVKSSADMLLTIINDILDYSKLEAGKMSIIATNYSPLSLINEVSNIILNRVGTKKIEYLVDMDPSLPCELMGDDVRIKQILVNLANNAVKFTNEGQVVLSVNYKEIDADTIMLKVAVSDTGIGIKPEHLERLFNSFEQVDSKRNRKVEGTGLGLAIVKELVENMGGTVEVTSEYGKGSVFAFEIPQKVVNRVRSVELLEDCPTILGIITNPYVKEQLNKDMLAIGAQYMDIDMSALANMYEGGIDYIFIEDTHITEGSNILREAHPDVKFVIVNTSNGTKTKNIDEFIQLHRPLSVNHVAAILNNVSTEIKSVESKEVEIDFKAPKAKIMIVDDNEVNLSVAEGLLEPLEMQIDLAESGMLAIDKVSKEQYDIIFMDHMMPEMDGIEATQIIRKDYENYKETPIIALTANALSGMREEFMNSGMNDFVAKPIELATILEVLKKHLPEEKIEILDRDEMLRNSSKNVNVDNGISGMTFLDTKYALELLKSESLYWKVLKNYYVVIDKKLAKIKQYEANEEIGNYIVEVHALKSSSKQIGAMLLSKKAENLEAAGNRHDIDMIHNLTDEMLDEYRNLQTSLAPYFIDDEDSVSDADKVQISEDELKQMLSYIADAIDELDFDSAEGKMQELKKVVLDAKRTELVDKLADALTDMDMDECINIIEQF